jgi:hypothetical protein
MQQTPPPSRTLLEQAGYVWDDEVEGWVRQGEKRDLFHGRLLDGAIAASLTPEQLLSWIRAGES